MIASSKEADSPTRQEANINDTKKNNTASSSADASPTSWFRLKDPRIVRVSRAFGGKDRHSKVCTVRGLRDRRVRLSVQTAIQLYDLQDRLGLNQPSKVVDWLLNAAKHEIDELPPLPIPPGCFSFNHQMMLASQTSSAGASQPNRLDDEATAGSSRSNFLNSTDAFWRDKFSKDISREPNSNEGDFTRSKKHEEERQGGESTEGWVNNSVPFGSVSYQLEPQNFAYPTILTGHGFASNTTEGNNLHLDNFNFVQLPSTLSLSSSSGTHQIFVPSHQEIDPRTISHLQMLSSATQTTGNAISAGSLHNIPPIFSAHQSLRPFQLSMTSSRPLHAQGNTTQTQPDKGHD